MNKIALYCPMIFLLIWPDNSFAYRPFDSTDAAVADVGELEIELGPAGFRRSDAERTVIAPAYVLNYGFAKNWELVLEGQAEHPLSPAEDTRSRLVGNGLFLKGVLKEGVLQDKSGPSVATEFGILLPGINDEHGVGVSWLGILSQRWAWGQFTSTLARRSRGSITRSCSWGPLLRGRTIGKSAPLLKWCTRENSTRRKHSPFSAGRFGG